MLDSRHPVIPLPDRPAELTADLLTEREREVLTWIVRGLANQQIAERLKVSEHTVWNHVTSILAKLHLTNRTQAAMYALRQGIVKLEEDL
jgi:NarL family two-component system response regulator LiaR